MKVLLVEDENLAVERLKRLINQVRPEMDIIHRTESVAETVTWLTNNEVDLIFMDIHLSDGSAFNIFEKLDVRTPIIFATAYDQYAIQAFRANGIDYLLKPVTKENLEASFEKIERIGGLAQHTDQFSMRSLLQQLSAERKDYQKRFLVHYGQKIKSISIDQVAYFFADQKMVFMRTKDGIDYVLDESVDALEQKLDPDMFYRINRKFLICIDSINQMYSYSKSRVKLDLSPECNLETIVSVEKSGGFKAWLNK